MKIEELVADKKKLDEAYNLYIKKKLLKKSDSNLSKAHLFKSDSNMEFVDFLLKNDKFPDWCIVGLYYSVYHASLALLSHKGYSSKDHNATLCFIIKNFSEFSKEDMELIDNLQIKKDEIEFYSSLKEERRKASYSTSLLFDKTTINDFRKSSIQLINKIKAIIS